MRRQTHLNSVIQELQQAQLGNEARKKLIMDFEARDTLNPRRLLIYVANISNPNSAINPNQTLLLADALASIGQAPNLDLMIHTAGGSGEMAEKIVEMCRNHCTGEFRVIIPNLAKSAGTLIALGADKIIMGHCSEVGPIDPQIRIMVGNAPQMVSAWTFIHARDELAKKVNNAIAKKEDATAHLQQLATIDTVFVKHCEQIMEFAKKVGRKWIAGRLTAKSVNQSDADNQADKVISFLCDVEQHILHGRLILAGEFKKHCCPPLEVESLEETDELWQLLWQLYVRCEVFLMMPNPIPVPKAVLIETSQVSLTVNG